MNCIELSIENLHDECVLWAKEIDKEFKPDLIVYIAKGGYPKTKKLIAIASQDWFTDKTKEIVRAIANNIDFNKYEIIIYPHYREMLSQYNDIMHEFPQIKIVAGVRHSNIDLLITFYSTIVYDFWSVNKDLPVICLHIDGYEATYYRRKNVYVAESIEEISRILSEWWRNI